MRTEPGIPFMPMAFALGATLVLGALPACGGKRASRAGSSTTTALKPQTVHADDRGPDSVVLDQPGVGDLSGSGGEAGVEASPGDALSDDLAPGAESKSEAMAEAAAMFGSPLRAEVGSGGGGEGGGGGGGNDGDGGPNFPQPLPEPSNTYSNPGSSSVGGAPTVDDGDGDGDDAGLDIESVTNGVEQVPLFDRIQLTVVLDDEVAEKPYDPDPSNGGLLLDAIFRSPSGVSTLVPGFWDGSAWRIRFAPGEAGAWTYDVRAVDAGGEDRKAGTFTAVTAGAKQPWLRIEGDRLRSADGRVFRGVGYNIGWQSDVEALSLQTLLEARMNVLSFWLQVPWNPTKRATLEAGAIGTYDQESSLYLDGVVERAENLGVRLLPSIWAHPSARDASHPWSLYDPDNKDWMWDLNSYSALGTAADFYRVLDGSGDPTPQWRAQMNLYRYMMARWGTSPAIIGWVAMVEANGTNGWIPGNAGQAVVATWTSAVRDYFASIDPQRRNGVAYPMTTSLTRNINDSSSEPKILDLVEKPLHLLGSDSYEAEHSDNGIVGILGAYQERYDDAGKLGIITEWGVYNDITPEHPVVPSVPLHLHEGLWAVVGAGGTIAPLLWSDELRLGDSTQHFALPDAPMRMEFERVGIFFGLLGNVTGRVFDGVDLTTTRLTSGGLTLHSATVPDAGVAWLRTDLRTNLVAGSMTIPGMTPGVAFLVTWFDTSRAATDDVGEEVEETASAGGVLTVTLPDFAVGDRPDVAAFFRLKPTAALVAPSGSG